MHAYLLIGEDAETSKDAKLLADKLGAKVLEFPLEKIEDVRQLNSFVGLSVGEPTAILVRNLNLATVEALNAFLKNLEEPQEGLYYILTSQSLKSLPETIVSRCQIISLKSTNMLDSSIVQKVQEFLKAPVGIRLARVAEIRDRQEAKDFTSSLIIGCHSLMLNQKEPTIYSRAIRTASFTRRALQANGNVVVQLANLAVSLV